jgi:hypothetical protein
LAEGTIGQQATEEACAEAEVGVAAAVSAPSAVDYCAQTVMLRAIA